MVVRLRRRMKLMMTLDLVRIINGQHGISTNDGADL